MEGKALSRIGGAAWIDDDVTGVAPGQGEVRETLERRAGEYRAAGIIATAMAGALQALTVLIDQAAKMGADG